MNDPTTHSLTFTHSLSLACSSLALFFSFSSSHLSRRFLLLLSSALGGRRVAILALGLFVKLTTELAPSPSLLRTHYAASLSFRFLSVSGCLF